MRAPVVLVFCALALWTAAVEGREFRRKENKEEKVKRKQKRKKEQDQALYERRQMYDEWCADKGRSRSSSLCHEGSITNKKLNHEELTPEFWQMHESYCDADGRRDETSPCRRWVRKQQRDRERLEDL
jgi:hypothetical protein